MRESRAGNHEPLPSIHRFASVAMSPKPNSFVSAVAKVRPSTLAVAARKRSAGSRWGSISWSATSAISWVNGASRNRDVALCTQSAVSSRSRIRPFLARTSTSQVLIGDNHCLFSGFLSTRAKLTPILLGSLISQIQMCVSSSRFNPGEPPNPQGHSPEKRYHRESQRCPS
jgi:hypothetical protein